MPERIASLRANATPRDLLGRVEWLLLAFALLNSVGALVVVLASDTRPPVLGLASLIAAPALAMTWILAYRRRSFGLGSDIVAIGGICLITMAVNVRWNGDALALLSAAVFFSAAYGSLPHVLIRTGLLASIELGQGVSDPATLPTAFVFSVGLVGIAILMRGMASSITRYEETSRRERVLAATGLGLVSAADMPDMLAAAIKGARDLCAALPGGRVSLARPEGSGGSAASSEAPTGAAARGATASRFKVLAADGEHADEWREQILDAKRLGLAGTVPADQWRMRPAAADAEAGLPHEPTTPRPEFLPGEPLFTSIVVWGNARGFLIVE